MRQKLSALEIVPCFEFPVFRLRRREIRYEIFKIITQTIGLTENCWVIVHNDDAIVIDPGSNATRVIKFLEQKQLNATKILATHNHFDHTGAVPALVKKTGAKVHVHKLDTKAIEQGEKIVITNYGKKLPPTPVDQKLTDNDIIKFGNKEIKTIATPGHTAGSCCFLFDEELFTGDTLFYENYGRTDLPGGSAKAIRASLQKLLKLPSTTHVHPGHGEDWTILQAQNFNFLM